MKSQTCGSQGFFSEQNSTQFAFLSKLKKLVNSTVNGALVNRALVQEREIPDMTSEIRFASIIRSSTGQRIVANLELKF